MENDEMFVMLERYLTSTRFNVPTKAILSLQQEVNKWISNSDCGAIIYGRPRIGKTRALYYISTSLKAKYGSELPIFILNATDHIPSDKFFYSQMLKAVGHPEIYKGTVLMLKDRLLNALTCAALETKYRKIVLFIDEAYLLKEKDYIWLMDIYNNLNMLDIQFTVFLIGSNELKQCENAFCAAKKTQLIGRFMVNEFVFKGITNVKDATICLLNMDKPLVGFIDNEIILTKLFFPAAYNDGKKISHCVKDVWDSFIDIMKENEISERDIPMKYFMDSIIYCLKTYGAYGKGIYFPDNSAWKDSIINSGFVKAERIGDFYEAI